MRISLIPIVVASLIAGSSDGRDESLGRPCGRRVPVTADTIVDRAGVGDSPLLRWVVVGGPAYPADLRRLGHGEVMATFVVDTTGRIVRGSAEILSESDVGFGRSVCAFLSRAKFTPAVVDGRKLNVRVSAAPYVFKFGQ